jgi:metal-sulfur cluster biosynthetic enzyme
MDEAAVRDALQDVMDPELGASVVDLGLVERIEIEADALHVSLATTSPACPMGDHIVASARAALARRFPAPTRVDVALVTDSGWTPERMSPELRARFGWA